MEIFDRLQRFTSCITHKRYIVTLFLMAGMSLGASICVTFSVAVVSMEESGEFVWSSKEKGILLSALFYGFIMTQIAGGLLARTFPANIVFGVGVLGACVFTLVTPLVATHFPVLISFKVGEGLFWGVTYPSMMCLMKNWAPPLERTRMILLVIAGNYLGPVIAMPLAGVMSDCFGWKSIFTCLGVLGVVWFIPFILFVQESPEKDKRMNKTEMQHILISISTYQGQTHDTTRNIPWLHIITSGPFWGIITANFTLSWGAYTLATQMPAYLNDINPELKMSLNGVFSMLPQLVTALLNPLAGYLADLAQETKVLTTIQVRKMFTCGAFASQCAFMLLSMMSITNMYASITFLSIGEGLAAFALCGFGVNYLDIAPQYSGVLVGISITIGTLAAIISPLLTGIIVKNHAREEWQIVFFITATIYLIGSLIYWFTASDEIQTWAQNKNEKGETESINKVSE